MRWPVNSHYIILEFQDVTKAAIRMGKCGKWNGWVPCDSAVICVAENWDCPKCWGSQKWWGQELNQQCQQNKCLFKTEISRVCHYHTGSVNILLLWKIWSKWVIHIWSFEAVKMSIKILGMGITHMKFYPVKTPFWWGKISSVLFPFCLRTIGVFTVGQPVGFKKVVSKKWCM